MAKVKKTTKTETPKAMTPKTMTPKAMTTEPPFIRTPMTEKKLDNLRDKDGFVRFLMSYQFSILVTAAAPHDEILQDAEETVCPPGYALSQDTFRLYSADAAKQIIVVLVTTRVVKTEPAKATAAAPPEPASETPALTPVAPATYGMPGTDTDDDYLPPAAPSSQESHDATE